MTSSSPPLVLVLVLLTACCTLGDDVVSVRQRLQQYFLANGDCTQMDASFCSSGGCRLSCSRAANYSASLILLNGSYYEWPDINYTDHTLSNWLPALHLQRTVELYRAFLCPDCPQRGNATLLRLAHGALGTFVRLNLTAPQWWWEQIGVPGFVATATTLADMTQPPLPVAIRDGALALIRKCPGSGAGQNLVWEQQILVFLAALTNDASLMAKSFATMWASVQVEAGDGVQQDLSFYQHGALLQSGAYGADFFLDLIVMKALASQTQFAAPTAPATVIDSYILDGEAFFMRWNGLTGEDAAMVWDIAAKGREISRQPVGLLPVNAAPLVPALRQAAASSPRGAELVALADRMSGNGSQLTGSRHFWRVDTSVHHTVNFSASVHMCSNRTYPTEDVNDENLLDWLAGAGAQYVMRDGGEYMGIFPAWNWLQLPGTTGRQNAKYSPSNVKNLGLTAFAGGATDGNYTVTALDYVECNQCGDSLSAAHPVTGQKAWFFLDDGFIALGANISCSTPGLVATTVNQALLRSSVWARTDQPRPWQQLAYNSTYPMPARQVVVLHDGLAYGLGVPAVGQETMANISVAPQSGTWYSINKAGSRQPVQKDVFKVTLDHGSEPQGAGYAYTVFPAATTAEADDMLARWQNSTVLLLRSASAIAIAVNRSRVFDELMMAAVFQPAVTVPGTESLPSAAFDVPATVLVGRKGALFTITASDPRQQLATMDFTLRGVQLSSATKGRLICTPVGGDTAVTVTLPQGLSAGQSVTGWCS